MNLPLNMMDVHRLDTLDRQLAEQFLVLNGLYQQVSDAFGRACVAAEALGKAIPRRDHG